MMLGRREAEHGAQFVVDARMGWAGQAAIAAVRNGDMDAALWQLESAKRAELDDETSRQLAITSGVVAVELERQAKHGDALLAWELAVLFSRDADDDGLEQHAREQAYALARAL